MGIDWYKASEIVFNGIVTGLFSTALVFATFRLGQWQSDRNWRRELTRRQEEQIAKDRSDAILRRVAALKDLVSALEEYMALHLATPRGQVSLEYLRARVQVAAKAWLAEDCFPEQEYVSLRLLLRKLVELMQGTSGDSEKPFEWDWSEKKAEGEFIPDALNMIRRAIANLDPKIEAAHDSVRLR